MEERPPEQEGSDSEQVEAAVAETAAVVERDAGRRAQLIEYGIEAADVGDGFIADWVAKYIAQELSDQPDSALGEMARTGEIKRGMRYELFRDYDLLPPDRRRWAENLASYVVTREDPGPVADWAERAVPPEHLAALEERLKPLENLGDIPLLPPTRPADSGFDWIGRLGHGWHVEPVWGRDGWDLGSWPYVAVALFVDEIYDRYAVATYVEGDVTVARYASLGALHVAVNEIAEYYWRSGDARCPDDLPEHKGILRKHCGPFSQARLEREKAEEQRRQAWRRGEQEEHRA